MTPRFLAISLSIAMIALPAIIARAESVISLHPDNGHYFLFNGKPAVLVTSGEHYGALLNLDFDFDRYFETLAKDGLNHSRLFSGTYRELPESFGIQANTLAPSENRYIAPWIRSSEPGYHHGGAKFDLSKFEPAYFERLHALMTSAQKHGIVIEFNLFCPLYGKAEWQASPFRASNNVNGVGNCPMDEVLTLKHPEIVKVQEAYVRKAITELNRYGNLYFEICNEPYIKKVPDDWQAHMTSLIRETESKLPNRHLISLNVANGRAKVENPPDDISIFNFHYCVPPDVVSINFGLNRVIGENETGFRGSHDFLYRSEAWDFLLAGGGLYNNLDYSFSVEHPDGTLRGFKSPGGGSPELRRQLGILKRFLESLAFIEMKPDPGCIVSSTEPLVWQALAEHGAAYAIYLHVPVPNKPKNIEDHLKTQVRTRLKLNLPPGSYSAEWLDPKTGTILKNDAWKQSDNGHDLESPAFDNDIALKIVAVR